MNTTHTTNIPIQEKIHQVEALMSSQAAGYHPDLRAALDHLLSSGGKRIRPTITLTVGKIFDGDADRLITLAAAIELLHTATLVHDDLIDGSLLRRGIPTLNSQWSPGATVLTGDFLFARAAKLAADTNSIPVMSLFAKTLTVIVNGEITQMFTSRCRISREDYYQRIYAKTASLFEASTTCAALIADVDEIMLENMRQFGYEMGMAFQIVDDILDFTGEQTKLGKPVGNDLRQGLITLPALFFIEKNSSDPDVAYLLEGNCPKNEQQLDRLINNIRKSDAIAESLLEANQYVEKALVNLDYLPDCPEKESLINLTQYITKRNI